MLYAQLSKYNVSASKEPGGFTDASQVGSRAVAVEMIGGKPNEDKPMRLDSKGEDARTECTDLLNHYKNFSKRMKLFSYVKGLIFVGNRKNSFSQACR
ncbi:MAG: hypothetical protein IKM28_11105 [Lachnospiraceae bacterium]|nr:hypothetical protein [Lachnospiraceae bacterium]